ncbi:NFACT family protein [Candidatus Bipolaricaulota bacterium]|nr:NFACT family protein [Candidatus Bipolaricaulota bacterium]
MALDGITLHGIKREIQEKLTGGWVRKIYQPRSELVTVNVWNGDNFKLLISCGEDFRIQLTDLDFDNPQEPPPFTMLLRKHLSGGKITRITQRGLDRVLRISVGVKDGEGDGENDIERKDLYVELMGRNSNLFLVREGKIIGTLKEKQSWKRSVSRGDKYQFPPGQDKVNPFELRKEEFYEFLGPDGPVWRNLLNNIEGIGPTLAREIAVRAEVPPEQKKLSETDREVLWKATNEFFDKLASGEFTPLVYQEDGKPVEFSPIKLESYSDRQEISFDTLGGALDHYYGVKESGFEIEELRKEIATTLDDELQRVEGALKNVEEQIRRSKNREKLKETGDIILTNLSQLEKGLEKVELDDPYEEEGKKEVDLDPSLTPEENAQRYYERYKKLKRGRKKLDRRKKSLKRELKYLKNLEEQCEEAETVEGLARIEGELKEKGYIEEEVESSDQGEAGGPKEYWVKGYKVLVGRNARQNDNIVREASRDDLWFHIRNYSGAHVVVVTDGRPDQVPEEVIVKAAQLAAANSKARGAEKATVSYTQVKYVDKPKGAKPGLVQITNESTITVSPEEVIS